jgi:hypothetical protein
MLLCHVVISLKRNDIIMGVVLLNHADMSEPPLLVRTQQPV